MRQDGIFSPLGALDLKSTPFVLSPSAVTAPTAVLQEWLSKNGTPGIQKDGKYGQCSASSFRQVMGKDADPESLSYLFNLPAYGVAPSQVQVWKPGPNDVCSNGTDAYKAPPPSQKVPDPAIMLAAKLGIPVPADHCSAGRYPDMTTQACECQKGTYENVDTGACEPYEQPPKGGGTPTTQTKLNRLALTRVVRPLSMLKTQQPAANLSSILTGMTKVSSASSSSAKPVTSSGTMTLARPGTFLPSLSTLRTPAPGPLPAGNTGKYVAIAAVVAALAAGAWYLSKKKG